MKIITRLLLLLRVSHTLFWVAILRRREQEEAIRKVETPSKKDTTNSSNSSGRSVSAGGMVGNKHKHRIKED